VTDPEIGWIVACLRWLPGPATLPTAASLDWDRALAIAEREGLAPALGFAVKADAPAAMPPAIRERLRRHFTDSTAGQLILTRELARLLEAFDGHGVPVIPLKGPALAAMLYPHPGLRPCSDLDLLIRREALSTADRLLQHLGYRRTADDHSWAFDVAYDRATLYQGPGGIHVDLHWSLLSDQRFSWNEAEGLTVWERAIPTALAGGKTLALCPEDLLLYLAVHLAVHHGLTGLLWYWDLARLLAGHADRLDWEAVVARASRWRVRTALDLALRGCERLFGVSAPSPVLSRLRARGPRAAAVRWLVRHGQADRLTRLEHLIAVLLVDRGRDLIRPLRDALLPSPAWLRARYEGAGSSLLGHYLAHWRRIGEVVGSVKQGLRSAR
jgi:hypothetical protein